MAPEVVDEGEGDVVRAGALRNDVVAANHAVAAEIERVHVKVITPDRGHQLRVQREFPLHDVAVVVLQHVLHLDVPVAVERTADQRAEILVRVIDLRHLGNVGGINAVGVRGVEKRRQLGVPMGVVVPVEVAGTEQVPIVRGILVTQGVVV